MKNTDFCYYTYEVGRYTEKNYKPETKKLVWNVIDYDFNSQKIEIANLFECNYTFLKEGLLYAKKHYANDFIKFAEHVREWLQHEYWSRSEYEIIVSGWPGVGISEKDLEEMNAEMKNKKHFINHIYFFDDTAEKIDIYTQIMLNWDRFIEYVWNNKRLITKKKLGL